MKTPFVKSLAMLFVLASALTSCELAEKLDDVKFDQPVEGSITVAVTEEGENMPYEDSILIDPNDNTEIEKYKNKIKSFTINSVSYTVSGFTGDDDATATGDVYYVAQGSTQEVELGEITNINLKQLSDSGSATEMQIDDAKLQAMAALLKNGTAVTIYLSGTISKTPAAFEVGFIVDATIEAEAID